MIEDAKNLARVAQRLLVEKQVGSAWIALWGAAVDRIEINAGASPSSATIWFPSERWETDVGLAYGDRIRIRTDWPEASGQATVFSGFVVNFLSESSGGSRDGGAFERNAVVCLDHRWLMRITSPVFGQYARGPDDYSNYGTDSQGPLNSCRFLTGRRAIFNEAERSGEGGRPNKDPVEVVETTATGTRNFPVFMDSIHGAEPWTAGDMIRYILAPRIHLGASYWDYTDPTDMYGLDHADFDRVVNHVVVDGLSVLEAIETICRQIGFTFRETYSTSGRARLAFYKIGSAAGYVRETVEDTILHQLHAPAAGESISTAVADAKKMLWAHSMAEDISGLINNPWGIGAPDRVEFTAELLPGWLDSDLVPVTTGDGMPNLYLTEAEISELSDPNAVDYYKYYHARGSSFRSGVGRKWVLNETGLYSGGDYDRGMPFDFSDIDSGGDIFDSLGRHTYALIDSEGKRNFGPFRRRLLPCLTVDQDDLNSVGIIVEFSFDSGTTWQKLECSIQSLTDEAGILITDPNLSEMIDQAQGTISGGTLDGVELNYWTSLCDDKVNSRVFKTSGWHTRIRVTACVQLDQRLRRQESPSEASGSPFNHIRLYDFSERYGLAKRASTSRYTDGTLSADEQDHYEWFGLHLSDIRRACEDASISGKFTLDRLWLGDGVGLPAFLPGDCIERITGREYSLAASVNGNPVYPEIIKIVYLPDRQQQILITRDLRYADVVMG